MVPASAAAKSVEVPLRATSVVVKVIAPELALLIVTNSARV